MPFIALCPHCRVCRLRAPKAKLGQSFRCPKCQEVFQLTPVDEVNSEELNRNGQESTFDPSHSTTVSPTTNGPSTQAALPETNPDDQLRMVQVALGAIVVELILSQLPYGRPVAVLIAFFASANAALELQGVKRMMWLGACILFLNVVVLLILVAFPGTLGLNGWWPDLGHHSEASQADLDQKGEWIDAGDAAWQQRGVRVAVTFATISTNPSPNTSGGKSERYLWIGIKLANVGVINAIEFCGWNGRGSEGPVLSTTDGTLLATKQYLGPKSKTIVDAGRFLECMLAFEIPPPDQDLLLDLPTQPFGDDDLIRFRISHDLVGRK
jgi:hypothetical protein